MMFKIVKIEKDPDAAQLEQFVAMMQRMYDYHATLHADWKTRPDWQQGSAGWIRRAAGGDEFFFGLAYPLAENGQIITEQAAGYIIGSFHYEAPLFIQHKFGYIADLWVEEAYRGTGVANLLADAATTWFKAQGVDRVQIEVDVNNISGLRFWNKAGFEQFELVLRRNI